MRAGVCVRRNVSRQLGRLTSTSFFSLLRFEENGLDGEGRMTDRS